MKDKIEEIIDYIFFILNNLIKKNYIILVFYYYTILIRWIYLRLKKMIQIDKLILLINNGILNRNKKQDIIKIIKHFRDKPII